MNKKLICERLELAGIYAEDGAMGTALEVVREAEQLLLKEIARRAALLGPDPAPGKKRRQPKRRQPAGVDLKLSDGRTLHLKEPGK